MPGWTDGRCMMYHPVLPRSLLSSATRQSSLRAVISNTYEARLATSSHHSHHVSPQPAAQARDQAPQPIRQARFDISWNQVRSAALHSAEPGGALRGRGEVNSYILGLGIRSSADNSRAVAVIRTCSEGDGGSATAGRSRRSVPVGIGTYRYRCTAAGRREVTTDGHTDGHATRWRGHQSLAEHNTALEAATLMILNWLNRRVDRRYQNWSGAISRRQLTC